MNETEQIFLLNPSGSQNPSANQKIIGAPVQQQDVGDFSTVCRTCATVTEFVIPIFEGEGLQNNLAEKIHKHLPIQVCESDVLPRVVCYQCASTLLAWHELVQCCVQADAALRTRLAVAPPSPTEPEPITKEVIQNTEEEPPHKYKEIAEFVVQTMDPPEYPAEGGEGAGEARRTCGYCGARHAERAHAQHLVAAHAHLLFHCDECDTYVDRKDFILHMSMHAVEYAARRDEPPKRERRGRRRRPKDDRDAARSPGRARSDERDGRRDDGGAQENAFSDHSETDYGFGPLPESVFEAIEDSQDGRPPDAADADEAAAPGPANMEPEIDPAAAPEPADAREPRACAQCGKTYRAASSYFYHMRHAHGGAREHECDVCGRKFGTRATLADHRTLHTGECAHACATCGKRFRARASLYIHARTHAAARRWACAACPRAFHWRAQLARHALRHRAERAHACAACPRAFSVRADLLRHARTHAPAPVACPLCARSFAQRRYLNVHLRAKHARDPRDAAVAPPPPETAPA